ncbi:hypothetical protein PILCRDRAFT_703360 [Piloderma croceum F 1598]|uniref:Uncharacterized protein n=1 Tax=Piloderma croceum (strain F 1598) TaxID=765440 RepID=A0A0C3F362_PILCF|nr:hypothetical protein PILCRDRAFT_703360 [Piloderma croceum F 1598]
MLPHLSDDRTYGATFTRICALCGSGMLSCRPSDHSFVIDPQLGYFKWHRKQQMVAKAPPVHTALPSLCSTIVVVMSAPSTTSYYPFDSSTLTVFRQVQVNNYFTIAFIV